MLLIVEGCTGSGKSTLIDNICKKNKTIVCYNRDYENTLNNNDGALLWKYGTFAACLALSHKVNIIVDRFHLSEEFFGNFYRNVQLNFNFVEEAIIQVPHLLIFLDYDECTLRKRITERARVGEDFLNRINLIKQQERLQQLYEISKLNKVKNPSILYLNKLITKQIYL